MMLNVTLPLLRVQRLLPPEPLALRLTCQEEVTDLCIEPFRAPKNAKMTTGGQGVCHPSGHAFGGRSDLAITVYRSSRF